MKDRRDFLRMMGLTTAVVGSVDGGEVLSLPKGEAPLEVPKYAGGYPARKLTNEYFDFVSGDLYDTITIRAGELTYRHEFFSTPYMKGAAETNVTQARRLDAPCMFVAKQIGVVVNAPYRDSEFRQRFLANYCLELWLGQRLYFRSPLTVCVATKRWDGDINEGFYKLDLPIVIGNDYSFFAQINGTPINGNPEMKMQCFLRGLHARGIS